MLQIDRVEREKSKAVKLKSLITFLLNCNLCQAFMRMF